MPNGIVIWLILFAFLGCVFFCVAAWVTVTGVQDLRDLLKPPTRDAPPPPES